MFGHRQHKLMRLEIFLFGLGCLGTVLFTWVVRPDVDTSMKIPEGPYSFSVSGVGDLRYLEDMKRPTDESAGFSDSLVEEVSPVTKTLLMVDDAPLPMHDVSEFSVPKTEVRNPYLDVD